MIKTAISVRRFSTFFNASAACSLSVWISAILAVKSAYRKAKNKEKYRAAHERDIILHEAAARAMKAAGVTKFPNLAALQSEYEALQAQKEALYADYGKLKKQVREYDVIKQNIDSILRQDREPERGKETERG